MVDDHEAVLVAVVTVLEHANFHVLSALGAWAIKLTGHTRHVDVRCRKRKSASSQLRMGFIRKPFLAKKLVQMVTDLPHSPDRSQLGGQDFDRRKDLNERSS